MGTTETFKIGKNKGILKFDPTGYWSLRIGLFFSTEDLKNKRTDNNGQYSEKEVLAARLRLITRARDFYRKKEER